MCANFLNFPPTQSQRFRFDAVFGSTAARAIVVHGEGTVTTAHAAVHVAVVHVVVVLILIQPELEFGKGPVAVVLAAYGHSVPILQMTAQLLHVDAAVAAVWSQTIHVDDLRPIAVHVRLVFQQVVALAIGQATLCALVGIVGVVGATASVAGPAHLHFYNAIGRLGSTITRCGFGRGERHWHPVLIGLRAAPTPSAAPSFGAFSRPLSLLLGFRYQFQSESGLRALHLSQCFSSDATNSLLAVQHRHFLLFLCRRSRNAILEMHNKRRAQQL